MSEVYNVFQGKPKSITGGAPIYGLNKIELFKLISIFQNEGGSTTIVGRKIYIEGKIFEIYKVDEELGDSDDVKMYYQNSEKSILYVNGVDEKFFANRGVLVTRKLFEEYEAQLGIPQDKPTAIDLVKMIAKKNTNRKIFVSHSSKDEILVSKFVDTVLILGMGVKQEDIFYTSGIGTGIKSGEDFKQKIQNELAQAKAVIQILTPNYKESEVCLNEMGAAWVLSDIVIPLLGPPYNYDVGFIHSTNQQIKMNSHDRLMQVFDDYKKELFNEYQKTAVLNSKIKEFINYLDDDNKLGYGKYSVH